MMPPLIEVKDLVKIYEMNHVGVHALRNVSATVCEGEFLAVTGPSGSGKSTLLHILSCLDMPTSGQYFLRGKEVGQMSEKDRSGLRNHEFGFVFQNFNLLGRLNVIENIELPLIYAGWKRKERCHRADELAQKLGLAEFAAHTPNQLSGGQQQRVAIARALVAHPSIVFADEPTGNLDTKTGIEMMSVFQSLNREEGLTLILVTHEPDIVRFAKRVMALRDGQIVADHEIRNPVDAREELRKVA